MKNETEGTKLKRVKSWSATKSQFHATITLFPLSTAATGYPGSPIDTRFLSSKQIKAVCCLNLTAISR